MLSNRKWFNLKELKKSFLCAFQGVSTVIRTEQNFRIHLLFIPTVTICGIFLSFSPGMWAVIAISIFFVLTSELFNTAIERLCDKIAEGKINKEIGIVKDISAGAVLFSALNAFIVGLLFIIIPAIKMIFLWLQHNF